MKTKLILVILTILLCISLSYAGTGIGIGVMTGSIKTSEDLKVYNPTTKQNEQMNFTWYGAGISYETIPYYDFGLLRQFEGFRSLNEINIGRITGKVNNVTKNLYDYTIELGTAAKYNFKIGNFCIYPLLGLSISLFFF